MTTPLAAARLSHGEDSGWAGVSPLYPTPGVKRLPWEQGMLQLGILVKCRRSRGAWQEQFGICHLPVTSAGDEYVVRVIYLFHYYFLFLPFFPSPWRRAETRVLVY